ncbi:MAG: haloacid dehalogenase superfamily protein subfamily variant 3 with third motif having or [Bacteroidetes bacterium]|nr:haloacid dehalogenase superfamily protein subfamily variant 3 with third motif having or [Bacteroidota bacterium]
MDGLLIDSEPYWRKSMMKVLDTVGLHLTDEQCAMTTGLRFDHVLEYWFEKYPWDSKSIVEVHEEILDEMEHAIANEAEILPGVFESIDLFRSKGYKLALASSSAMRLIKACVKRLNAEEIFESVISAEHEEYGKPHPAVFLKAAKELKVHPLDCIVLEDSLMGVIAAKAARMQCVAIPPAENYDNPKFVIADWKLRSLVDIASIL